MFIDFSSWKWKLILIFSIMGNVFMGVQIVKLKFIEGYECKLKQKDKEIEQLVDDMQLMRNLVDSYLFQRAFVTNDLLKVAERARQARIVYQQREVPAATCAPGPERVEATNEILATDFTVDAD